MHQKFLSVRLNKYKQNNFSFKKQLFLLIGVSLLFFSFFWLDFQSKNTPKTVPVYCDSDLDYYTEKKNESCENCPNNSKCKGGKITECYGYNYILQDQKCVENEALILLQEKMLSTLETILARKKGNSLCYQNEEDFVRLDNLENVLKGYFKNDEDFSKALRELKNNLEWDNRLSKNIKTKYINGDYLDVAVYSDNIDYSLFCEIKIFANENYKTIFLFIILVVLILGFILRKLMRKKYILIAEQIYKEILADFRTKDKIDSRELIKDPDFVYTKRERDVIMEELENIRKVDEQITYFMVNDIKFWVPL